jgi:hypothetical protein
MIIPFANTEGDIVCDQTHVFTCERCGMATSNTVPIPAPFTIKYECKKDDKKRFYVQTTKTGKGGPLTSIKEYIGPPEKPSNIVITSEDIPGDPTKVKFIFKWTDNSDIETGYVYQLTIDGLSSALYLIDANVTEKRWNSEYKKTYLNGKTIKFKVKAKGLLIDSAFEEKTMVLTYDL